MYNDFYERINKKKHDKKKIKIYSFINNFILNIYEDQDIDIFRFDLDEFAKLYGYKDETRVLYTEILPLLKNIKIDKEISNKFIAIDLPICNSLSNNTYSLDNILNFLKNSNADMLCFNVEYNFSDLIKKLTDLKIPIIAFARNNNIENKNYINNLLNKLIEVESQGALMIILEDFSSKFIQDLKNKVLIPVICNFKEKKSDGIYIKFSSCFGLFPNYENTFLNLYDVIKEGIKDSIIDND